MKIVFSKAFWLSLGLLTLACVGVVYAISFPQWWFLAPFSLGLFIYDLNTSRSWSSAVLRSFVFGLASGGAGIWWFWDTLPLDWLGLARLGNQWYFVFASWGPVACMFATITALFGFILWKTRSLPYAPLVAAGIWTIMEQARMWGFFILTYAPRALAGPHFSSTSIGYTLVENPYLLQIAQGGGVIFLNFTVALFAAILAYAAWYRVTDTFARKFTVVISSFVLVTILCYPLVQGSNIRAETPITAALVTSNLPTREVLGVTSLYVNSLEKVAESVPEADLIVLPEEMRMDPPFKSTEEKIALFSKLFKGREVVVISDTHVPTRAGFNLMLTYEDAHANVLNSYNKRFLMPGGEYMPTMMLAGFSLLPDSGLTKYLDRIPSEPAPYSDLTTAPLKGHTVGGLICSDFLSPVMYRELAQKHGADILVNSANPAWFHGSKILFDKTVQISKVHAVQSRAYYVQASNGSPSFAIDPQGRVIAMSDWGFVGVLPVLLFDKNSQ